jgi:hypothetical protein
VTDTLACIKKWQNKMMSSKVKYNSNNIHRQDPGFIILHDITGEKKQVLAKDFAQNGLACTHQFGDLKSQCLTRNRGCCKMHSEGHLSP